MLTVTRKPGEPLEIYYGRERLVIEVNRPVDISIAASKRFRIIRTRGSAAANRRKGLGLYNGG